MPTKRLASAVSVGSLPLQQLDPFQHNQERIELRAEPRIGRGGEEDEAETMRRVMASLVITGEVGVIQMMMWWTPNAQMLPKR